MGGVKLHAHVQCFALDGAALDEVCRVCSAHQKPLLIHAGREPWSPHYACDPRQLCRADHIESLLGKYPDLNICVPHLGADEFGAYGRLIRDYDNLWLDTTMALADFLPFADVPRLTDLRADRILFGTDFPNIPMPGTGRFASWRPAVCRRSSRGGPVAQRGPTLRYLFESINKAARPMIRPGALFNCREDWI